MQRPCSRPFSGFLQRARALALDNIGGGSRTRRGSNTRSISKSVLPPELWLKIFGHVPTYLLPSITLTCRSFRSLAQPLLFTTIATHPERSTSSAKDRRRVVDRLDFLFSPQIAPTVRGCKISPPSVDGDHGPADDLIDFIFENLPTLPNLRVLECRHVRLTSKRLAILQSLKLSTISLDMCFGDISEFVIARSMPLVLQDVSFKYPDSPKASAMPSTCPLFLSAPHLEHLHATTTEVLPTLARSQPFTKLRTLDLPVECLLSVDLLPALLRCPAVDTLSLYTTNFIPTTVFEALPEGVLPLLESYRGPYNFAAAFLNGRTTKCVDVSIPARPHSLVSSLLKLHRDLESLSFSLNSLDLPPAVMHTIHSIFPNLTSLAIAEPALSSTEIKAVLNSIPAHYNLEELTLRIQGRDKFNLWIPPAESAADAASCFNKVCTAVVKTYPAIQCVRFIHGSEGDSVAWRRSPRSGLFLPTGQ
ncbi:hypothetical protein B0H16DRAFT_1749507 [Mycena metata]|uniref:F-box domain-containing protein n=1 Tax=Mycena metata TaxID=1033252 RepID=A0AAD7DU94_9AGAR|nr:hypothetical protein B0H16DRAFT_1749507 [Mycena metata]